MVEGKTKTSRLVLRCADDDGKLMCSVCGNYFTSDRTLYEHMCRHSYSDWRKVLPKQLNNYSSIVVRHTFASPNCIDDEEEECLITRDGEVADLIKNKKLKVVDNNKKDEVVVPEGVNSKTDVVTGGGGFRYIDLNVAPPEDEE